MITIIATIANNINPNTAQPLITGIAVKLYAANGFENILFTNGNNTGINIRIIAVIKRVAKIAITLKEASPERMLLKSVDLIFAFPLIK